MTDARECFERSLALNREVGNQAVVAIILINLAYVALRMGDSARAGALARESRQVERAVGETRNTARAIRCMADIARAEGDRISAAAWYRESLALSLATSGTRSVARDLERFALVAADRAEWDRAALLLGAAGALRERTGTLLPRTERAMYAPTIAIIWSALGDVPFASACEAGRAFSLEQALAEALEEAGSGQLTAEVAARRPFRLPAAACCPLRAAYCP